MAVADIVGNGNRFKNYTWLEDMKAQASVVMLEAIVDRKFDVERNTSPFSYLYTTTYRDMLLYIENEAKEGHAKYNLASVITAGLPQDEEYAENFKKFMDYYRNSSDKFVEKKKKKGVKNLYPVRYQRDKKETP